MELYLSTKGLFRSLAPDRTFGEGEILGGELEAILVEEIGGAPSTVAPDSTNWVIFPSSAASCGRWYGASAMPTERDFANSANQRIESGELTREPP